MEVRPLNSTAMLVQMARGDFTPEVLGRLQRGAVASLREGGRLSADRLLGWPTTPGKRMKARRDYWLLMAASCLSDGPEPVTAGAMHRALVEFIASGPWASWSCLPEPPKEAARLNVALWHVARATAGQCLSLRTVSNIMRWQRIEPEFAGAALDTGGAAKHTGILTDNP